MRILSTIIGLAGTACLGAALWLLFKTVAFYLSDDYAPNAGLSFSYRVGHVEADGSGIFVPAFLLLAVAAFLLKFAFNLWREPSGDAD